MHAESALVPNLRCEAICTRHTSWDCTPAQGNGQTVVKQTEHTLCVNCATTHTTTHTDGASMPALKKAAGLQQLLREIKSRPMH